MKTASGLAILKVSVPGFWLIYSTPYVFGYLSAGPLKGGRFLFGLFTVWACVACIAILNECTDRLEDSVNQPGRVRLAEAVGYQTLARFVGTLFVGGLFVLAYVTIEVGPEMGVVAAFGGLVGLFYSIGPRFKSRGLLAQLVIPVGVVVPFLFGWMFNGRSWQSVDPVIFLLYYVYFAFSNVKNLPDTRGDALIGLRTIFTRPGKRFIRLVFLSPYLVIAVLVSFGVVGPPYLWTLVLLPGALVLLLFVARARTLEEKTCVYQAGFLYAHAFLICVLLIYCPTGPGVLAAVLLFGGRLLVTALKLDRRLIQPDLSVSRTLVGMLAARSGDSQEIRGA